MRILIKAVLAFLFVSLAAGILPVSALHLSRLSAMKAEFAAARHLPPPALRPSFVR